jgi:predicted transposase/invertase (TIGR01784 family)
VFKQVFGKQENERILISFLNAMLNSYYNIKSAKVINSDLPRFSELGRSILLDVQVQTDDGTHIDIEVQRSYKPDLIDRMFVYGANMITRYSEKSTGFNTTKCIAIWILDCNIPSFKMFGKEQVIGEFTFRSMIDGSKYLPIERYIQ